MCAARRTPQTVVRIAASSIGSSPNPSAKQTQATTTKIRPQAMSAIEASRSRRLASQNSTATPATADAATRVSEKAIARLQAPGLVIIR